MSLLVTGTIGIDTIQTPAATVQGVMGGSCAYFAAAASFHAKVRLVAAVGGDWPAEHRSTLEHFKDVDLSGLEVRPGSHTFRWGGKYNATMNSRETTFTELGVLLEPPPAIPAKFEDSAYVFLANSHPGVQLSLLKKLPKRRLAVADTMDLWISTAKPDLLVLLRAVDGLVLNYDEAELLTGKANTVSAARHILEMGPRFVVVKKGEHGCVLVHREGIAALPAYPTENVIDPTGAGDTFAGGMMGYIASHGAGGDPGSYTEIRKSLAHATVTASFTIEAFSLDRLKALTKIELAQRYDQFTSMVRV